MNTPRSWEELLEQVLVRRVPFLVTFFAVTFVTYLFLYVIDFYPEPPAATTDEAISDEDVRFSKEDEAMSDTSSPINVFEVIASAVTTVSSDAHSDEIAGDEQDSGQYVSSGIRDNIPSNLTVIEENGEPVVDLTASAQDQTLPQSNSVVQRPVVLPTKIEIPRLGKTISVLNPASRAIADLDAALLNGVVRHPDSADLANVGNIFILGHSSYLPNVLNKNFQAFNGLQKLQWGDEIKLYADGKLYVYRVDRVYEAKASEVVVPMTPGEARLTLATCDSFGSKDDRFIVEATLLNS